MKQKLIFLDIDGTLLPPGEMLIPQSTVEALHKAHANGHKLFLCTGRNLRMTQPLLDYGFDGAVCSAGGYVFCGDKVLVRPAYGAAAGTGRAQRHGAPRRGVHAGSAGCHLRQPEDDRALELHPPGCRPPEQRSRPLAQGHGGRHDHEPAGRVQGRAVI